MHIVDFHSIRSLALSLPQTEREQLGNQLLDSVEFIVEDELERQWLADLIRRVDAPEGTVKAEGDSGWD